MPWNTGRSKQLPPNWRRGIRPRILARDPICRRCGVNPSTEVHHAGNGNDHRDETLEGLCSPCHLKHTQADARTAISQAPRRARTPESHPGLT